MNDKYLTWGDDFYYDILRPKIVYYEQVVEEGRYKELHEFLHKIHIYGTPGFEESITLIKKEIPKFDF